MQGSEIAGRDNPIERPVAAVPLKAGLNTPYGLAYAANGQGMPFDRNVAAAPGDLSAESALAPPSPGLLSPDRKAKLGAAEKSQAARVHLSISGSSAKLAPA